MAGSKTGSGTVIRLARQICRVVQRFGVADLSTRATPEVAAAVQALVTACNIFVAADDFPGEIDHSGAHEDIDTFV